MPAEIPPDQLVIELIGVYNADGGLIGEARYLIGSLRGRTHCALCDITHSPVRRKKQWDEMAKGLGVPFALDHLNDMPRDVGALVSDHGAPLVAARLAAGAVQLLLAAPQLETLDGSVTEFEVALRHELAAQELHLAHPYRTPGL